MNLPPFHSWSFTKNSAEQSAVQLSIIFDTPRCSVSWLLHKTRAPLNDVYLLPKRCTHGCNHQSQSHECDDSQGTLLMGDCLQATRTLLSSALTDAYLTVIRPRFNSWHACRVRKFTISCSPVKCATSSRVPAGGAVFSGERLPVQHCLTWRLPASLVVDWQEQQESAGKLFPTSAPLLARHATPEADSHYSWTIDFAARRQKVREGDGANSRRGVKTQGASCLP